jgi:hypothetical protein
MMASQKPLKMAIALLSLAYNQAFILLDIAEGGFLRLRHTKDNGHKNDRTTGIGIRISPVSSLGLFD